MKTREAYALVHALSSARVTLDLATDFATRIHDANDDLAAGGDFTAEERIKRAEIEAEIASLRYENAQLRLVIALVGGD